MAVQYGQMSNPVVHILAIPQNLPVAGYCFMLD